MKPSSPPKIPIQTPANHTKFMKEQHSHGQEETPDHESVQTRQRAMVEAGTHPMIADRLARDAARGQFLRDRQLKLAASVVEEPLVVTSSTVVTEVVPVDASPDLHA